MGKLDELLARRSVRRGPMIGNPALARARAEHTRFIADHFASFDRLRSHLFHPRDFPSLQLPAKELAVARYLENLGWIAQKGNSRWSFLGDAPLQRYLNGCWLEELLYLAHVEAGVDELFLGQVLTWDVNGVEGSNEVDVLARRGNLLSFTSCKTMRPQQSDSSIKDLRTHLMEIDYLNTHFADDEGRTLLVVTADMVDEIRAVPRYPSLLARAAVLEVSVAGLEMIRWPELVAAVDRHWDTPPAFEPA